MRGAFGNHNHRLQPHTIAHRNHLDAFGVVVVRRRCLELSRNVGLGGLGLRERRQTRQSESQGNNDGTAEYGRPRVSWKTKTSRPQRRSASENRRVTGAANAKLPEAPLPIRPRRSDRRWILLATNANNITLEKLIGNFAALILSFWLPKLLGCRPADYLNEPIGPNSFRKSLTNLLGGHRKVLLRRSDGFVQWQASLRASQQPSGQAVFT